MKALVLSVIIALSFSFASAEVDTSCPLADSYFGNKNKQDGALTTSNAVRHVNSSGQLVVDAGADGVK